MRQGKQYYWMPLATSLRKLICRKEKKNSQHYPLLQRIAGLLDLPLLIYSNPTETPFPVGGLMGGCHIHLSVIPEVNNQVQMDLDCWLELNHSEQNQGKLIQFNNNKLISDLANREACHVDDVVFPFSDIISSVKMSEQAYVRSIYAELLIQVAQVTAFLSKQVVDHHNNSN